MLIDIATGVRPAPGLERVIADMWLQLAEVIIHDGPPHIPTADDLGPASKPVGRSHTRGTGTSDC
jgi:hypothetical protein